MGKREKHRRQQLRKIQERRQRYEAKMPTHPFSPGKFFRAHLGEIFFLFCFIAAFYLIYSIKPGHKNIADIEVLSSAVPESEINYLRQKYPQGFRVFALVKKEILPLNINTLPEGLKVNWGASKLLYLNRDEIKFNIARIERDSDLLVAGLPVKFPRREGKVSFTVVLQGIEISVELIAEYANTGIFFALGFKEI
jgi:hypothetical protein